MRHLGFCVLVVSCALVGASCGGGDEPADPVLVIGGGATGNVAIDGRLNVYVVDEATNTPIVGAWVQLGDQAALGVGAATDATGLAMLDVKGKQVVTASAASYVNQTWFDVDAPSVTIPLTRVLTEAVKTSKLSGTVSGWSDVPIPPTGHVKIGVVGFSVPSLDSPEAAIYGMQGSGGGTFAFPKNVCFAGEAPTIGSIGTPAECKFELVSRVGVQATFVTVWDYDTNGSFTDRSDDSVKLVAFGVKRNVALVAGDDILDDVVPITHMTVSNVRTSGGTMKIASLPEESVVTLIALGGSEGVIPLLLPFAKLATPRDPDVPALSGALATASFDFLLTATPATQTTPATSAISLVRDFKTGTPVFADYLLQPTSLTAAAGAYSFGPSAGAKLYVGAFRAMDAMSDAWTVVLLDPLRVSFSLPALPAQAMGGGLPAGAVNLTISAVDVPLFNPREFKSEDASKATVRLSTNGLQFMR